MHPDAVGWDWIGMNLDDGSALTAFRLRREDGTACGRAAASARQMARFRSSPPTVWSSRRGANGKPDIGRALPA